MGTPDQNDVALRAARQAVAEFANSDQLAQALGKAIDAALERIGLNAESAEAREAIRLDMIHLRTWREFWTFIQKKGIGTTINWLITGLLAAGASGIYIAFHK